MKRKHRQWTEEERRMQSARLRRSWAKKKRAQVKNLEPAPPAPVGPGPDDVINAAIDLAESVQIDGSTDGGASYTVTGNVKAETLQRLGMLKPRHIFAATR